jgi:hypothetical protein
LDRHSAYGNNYGVVAGWHIGHLGVDLVEARAYALPGTERGFEAPFEVMT